MNKTKFKTGDVVVTRTNAIYQVIKEFRNDKLGKQILCRKYRSQDRVAFMPWQIVKHPFFS
jgi:hypothetical protein